MLAVFVPIGVGGLLFFSLWIWSVLDVISTDEMLCRNLPKGMWVTLVLFMPMLGSVTWLIAGRPLGAPFSIGGKNNSYANNPNRSVTRGFEDSPEWRRPNAAPAPVVANPDTDITESAAVKERRLLEWEAELKKREAAISDDPVD